MAYPDAPKRLSNHEINANAALIKLVSAANSISIDDSRIATELEINIIEDAIRLYRENMERHDIE